MMADRGLKTLHRSRSCAGRRILFAITALLLAGCASTQDTDVLRRDVANLKTEVTAQKQDISKLKDRVSEIAKDAGSVGALRESQSSLLTQSSDFSKEIQVLRGRFDEYKYYTDKAVKDLQADREVQQARIARLETDLREARVKGGNYPADKKAETEAKDQQTAEKKPPETAKSEPQHLYDDAHVNFKEKHYNDARLKFEKFAKENPKNPLVPNAYFWIGETYSAERKYEDAILAYEVVIKRFPDHDKARAAMLKQGFAFIEIGDKKTGKVVLERLIEKYPQSTEAELAEKKIAEIFKTKQSKGKASQQKKKS